MTEEEYKRILRSYSRVLNETLLNLNYFIEDVGQINVFTITHRLKSYKSAILKSKQHNIPINELQDLAGIRIVVSTKNEVDVVSRFFTRQEYSKNIKIDSDKYITKKNGYRARHIVFSCEGNYNRSMYPTKVEVQLQTIFEHAFNFLSRAWVYKSDNSFSKDWESKFLSLSQNLSSLNDKANELHSEVVKSSDNIDSDDPLSAYSYQKIVKTIFDENISIEDAVDSCRFFVDLGLNNNKSLKEFFENKNVSELRREFEEFYKLSSDEFAKSVLNLSLYSFYTMFGVRYDATKEMLDKFRSDYVKTHTHST